MLLCIQRWLCSALWIWLLQYFLGRNNSCILLSKYWWLLLKCYMCCWERNLEKRGTGERTRWKICQYKQWAPRCSTPWGDFRYAIDRKGGQWRTINYHTLRTTGWQEGHGEEEGGGRKTGTESKSVICLAEVKQVAHLVKTKTGEPLQHAAGAARCNKKAKDTQKREKASKTELFKAVRSLFDCSSSSF